tara:strand:- start:63 stop:245 length:183 start_codon:yes stop_codon:yes gene_type:complete
MEEIIQKLRDLRDETPCNEDSHKLCGCEKFDEIIAQLINLNNNFDEQHISSLMYGVDNKQ